MNPYSTHNLYKNVFNGIQSGSSEFPSIINSHVVLAADFPNIQFAIFTAAILVVEDIVGTFIVGELITDSNTDATAIIYSIDLLNSTFVLINVAGSFGDGDDIVGYLSGATAAVLGDALLPDFTIQAFKSNSDLTTPPNPALPASVSNQYEEVMYTGEPGGVNYAVGFPYPQSGDVSTITNPKTFLFQTQGAIWVFLRLTLAASSGSVLNTDINIFNL